MSVFSSHLYDIYNLSTKTHSIPHIVPFSLATNKAKILLLAISVLLCVSGVKTPLTETQITASAL